MVKVVSTHEPYSQDVDLEIVIPSKSRHFLLEQKTLKLFPQALVCVDEEERDNYLKVVPASQLLLHPTLTGLPAIRNWIVKNVPNHVVFMVDDDIEAILAHTYTLERRYYDPRMALAIVVNAAVCAQGWTAKLFGFAQYGRVMAFKAYDPISLTRWVGTAVGVIGKSVSWDERLKLRGDVDASLRSLAKDRVIYTDTRFHFLSTQRLKQRGGSTVNRSQEQDEFELGYLKRKWGRYIHFKKMSHYFARGKKPRASTTLSPFVKVPRRQKSHGQE